MGAQAKDNSRNLPDGGDGKCNYGHSLSVATTIE